MLHWGHCVAGVRRLNPSPATRLAPLSRRSTVRFSPRPSMAATLSGGPEEEEEEEEKMEKSKTIQTTPAATTTGQEQQKVQHHAGNMNIMEDSFGEGYATRSDEEGFGGVYGGNQSLSDVTDPDYDKTQGSEVVGKERARNQSHASC